MVFPVSSIRVRLFLLVVLAVIPMFGLTLYTDSQERQIETARAKENALELVRGLCADHDRQIEQARQMLSALSQFPEARSMSPGACSPLFSQMVKALPVYDNMALIDAEGNVRSSAAPTYETQISQEPWFQKAIQSGSFSLGPCSSGKTNPPSMFVMGYPVTNAAGRVDAVICASFDLPRWVRQSVERMRLPPDTSLALLDVDGNVLARLPESGPRVGSDAGDAPILRTVMSQDQGMAEGVGWDGIPRLFGFSRMGSSHGECFIVVGIEKEAALARTRQKLIHNLLMLGGVTGLALCLALWSGDLLLLRRIAPLMSAVKQLGAGDLSVRTGLRYGTSEFSQLARTFDSMADALEERQKESDRLQKELRESAVRFEAIFNQAFQFTGVLKPDGTLLEANQTGLRFIGVHAADVNNRPFWETPWWSVSQSVRERLQTAITEAAGGQVVRYETDCWGPGGKIATIDFSLKPLRDESGQVTLLIAEGRDVTVRREMEKALRASEQRYRAIVEDQTELISRFSPDFRLTFVNDAYCRYFGESYDDLVGTDFWHHVPSKEREELRRHIASMSAEKPVATIEHRVVTPDGETRWQQWTDRAIIDDKGEIIEIQSVGRDITDRVHAEESLRASERALRLLSCRLLTVQEDERKRIARELHDSTGQSLTAIKFGIEAAVKKIREEKDLSTGLKSLEAIFPTVQHALDELRKIMTDLRPSILDDLGILATIKWFCRDYHKIYSMIGIEAEIDVTEEEIPQSLKTVIYRVIQESMNNIAKYSQASLVTLSLKKGSAGLALAVEDDGIGFDMCQPSTREWGKGGVGLSSMRERVELSGGSFTIRSIVGEGTRIDAFWPCSP